VRALKKNCPISAFSTGEVRFNYVKRFFSVFTVVLSLWLAATAGADDNVREVQTKLRDGGFYFGEIDGAFSSDLAAALSRYQIRNGLPITGQLDVETGKSLGAKPTVKASPADPARTSETWRKLRNGDEHFLAKRKANAKPTPPPSTSGSANEKPQAAAPVYSTNDTDNASSAPDMSTDRLRDYVAAFVLAGLDPQVGAETAFFAHRVNYYDDGIMDRSKIEHDLKRYDARWPERKFRLDGDITVDHQGGTRMRVTFPLRYELRNGAKHSSGKIDKSLVIETTGDGVLQIVAVNERKAR
jgi:peptidoglycan hydrolase-like protein with peptidoglycan-binding domain